MNAPAPTARARLDTWRAHGADRFHPVRFHAMDALERRAAQSEGAVQQVLHERLASLIDDYAADLSQAAHGHCATATDTPRPLRELVDHMAQHTGTRASASGDVDARAEAFPQLPALDEFRQRWSTLRSESHLRQSQADAPANAGPLNSAALVHRSISVMRELSPGYLQHFLAYVDHLAWLEQLSPRVALNPRVASPAKDTTEPAAGPKKRSRAKARTPRG